jgi:DNA-binding transcriptional LysR family regulator
MSADRLVAMEIFVRVVDAGSFSAAASQLGVGQPAVSKAVAQLEERLGVRLLLRSTRRLNLTDAGKTFYENAKRAIEQVNQAELAARATPGSRARSACRRRSASRVSTCCPGCRSFSRCIRGWTSTSSWTTAS